MDRLRPLLILLLASLTLLGGRALGQGSVGLDPVVNRFATAGGQSVTAEVNLTNPYEQSKGLKVLVYVTDIDQDDTGGLLFPKAGTLTRSAAPWIKVNLADMVLAAKERRTVRYTIDVPPGTPAGTYWAVMMFEAENPTPPSPTELARVNVRVGHGIFVNVGTLVNTGEITGIFSESPKKDGDGLILGVQFKNTGNAATQLTGYIDLRDERGKSVAKLPFEQTLSLPDRTTMLSINWLGPVTKGRYTALAVVNNGNEDLEILGEQQLTIDRDLTPPADAPAGSKP